MSCSQGREALVMASSARRKALKGRQRFWPRIHESCRPVGALFSMERFFPGADATWLHAVAPPELRGRRKVEGGFGIAESGDSLTPGLRPPTPTSAAG